MGRELERIMAESYACRERQPRVLVGRYMRLNAAHPEYDVWHAEYIELSRRAGDADERYNAISIEMVCPTCDGTGDMASVRAERWFAALERVAGAHGYDVVFEPFGAYDMDVVIVPRDGICARKRASVASVASIASIASVCK
jgi:hypothetical protein